MRLYEFNTGRGYSEQGQPIVAVHDEDARRVYFADYARQIYASFECEHWRFASVAEFQKLVMWVYDHGPSAGLRYETPSEVEALIKAANRPTDSRNVQEETA